MKCKLTAHIVGETLSLSSEANTTVYEALTSAGVYIDAPCGGRRRCAKCLCEITGSVSPASARELELLPADKGLRLACFAVIEGDCEVFIGAASAARIKEDGVLSGFSFAPRICAPRALGAAVDIGTTTVVAYLCDLETGGRLGVKSGMNAQRRYGADVISRITLCIERPDGLKILNELITRQVWGLIAGLVREAGRECSDVRFITVAGNTTMQHIFAGISPEGMAAAPFKPSSLFGEDMPANNLLPSFLRAVIYMLPAVAGYVGGDITAAILASGMDRLSGTHLLLDIGTNGEMALGGSDGLLCCATAAGPAFEGAGISCGMGGTDGAISEVSLENGEIRLAVIGGGEPTGVCGSGLVDALAVMLRLGAVDETGRLLPPDEAEDSAKPFLFEDEHGVRFALCPANGIYITERDVRELQLAKAAVAGGIYTLLREAGKTESDVINLFLAGGFGNYINKESAAAIGLIPPALADRVRPIGNGAGMGALAALIDKTAEALLSDIAKKCSYIELSGSAVFMEEYVNRMMF